MGRSRYTIYEHQATHFLTCTINNWIPIFTRPATVQVILDALAYRQAQRSLKIYALSSWKTTSI
jgi:putative transposase